MAEALTAVGAIAGLAGSVISARGTLAAGKADQQAANYEAAQLDVQASEERAAAQREALELRRQKNLALSALQARSAASGFTATDPTALKLAGEIASYGTLQEKMALYGGESRYAGYRAAATGRRVTGKAARQGARYGAAGTILGGISTMASRFGGSYDYG